MQWGGVELRGVGVVILMAGAKADDVLKNSFEALILNPSTLLRPIFGMCRCRNQ